TFALGYAARILATAANWSSDCGRRLGEFVANISRSKSKNDESLGRCVVSLRNAMNRVSTPDAGTASRVPFGNVIEPGCVGVAAGGAMAGAATSQPATDVVSIAAARCERRTPQMSARTANVASAGHIQRELDRGSDGPRIGTVSPVKSRRSAWNGTSR